MAKKPNRPVPALGTESPRFSGIATFMRLPHVIDPAGLDIALFGVPWDGGTTHRPGARHGPRAIREASSMIRRVHPTTGLAPFELCATADAGDAEVNPVDLMDTLERVERFVGRLHQAGTAPLAAGGDHLVTLPILRAIATDGPLGLIHFDAHSDSWDEYFGGAKYTHGTPFRRAVEEGLVDPRRTVQIGIRGSLNSADEMDFAESSGMRVMRMEEVRALGVAGVVAEARRVAAGGPAYVSFDVDGLDPAFAPGTGTPEIGGLSTFEAQQLIRGLGGLDLVGGDVVEVAPPFDPSGITALAAANLMFEILCVLAEAVAARRRA